jgi:hypothetical protein
MTAELRRAAFGKRFAENTVLLPQIFDDFFLPGFWAILGRHANSPSKGVRRKKTMQNVTGTL